MVEKKGFLTKLKTYILFAGPVTFFYITVILIPFLLGIYLTFTNWDGLSLNFSLVGFSNYIKVFNDKVFWSTLLLTSRYVIVTVILTNILAFILAYILSTGIKGSNFFKAGFFSSNLIGGIVLGLLWQFLFMKIVPYIGTLTGIEFFSKSWLGDPDKAFWAMVITSVWQQAGYMMVIYIAGLTNIPKELIEASEIDGAGTLKKISAIVFPLIIPAVIVCTLLSMQRGFLVYDLVLTLTNGGQPYQSTQLVTITIYNTAFRFMKYGPGQAQALILFIIVVIIALLQTYFSKKREVEL